MQEPDIDNDYFQGVFNPDWKLSIDNLAIGSKVLKIINQGKNTAYKKTVAYCLTISNDKIFVGGYIFKDSDWDAYICRLDMSNGAPVLKWERTFDYGSDEGILGIAYDSQKIFATGFSEKGGGRLLLLKYDYATGSREDCYIGGDDSNPAIGHAIKIYNGNIYIAGSRRYDDGLYRVIIRKYSTDLDFEWGWYLNIFEGGPEYAYDLDVANGNAYITGVCHYTGHEFQLYPFLIKFNVNSEKIIWSETYGMAWWSQVFESCLYDGNRIYVTGNDMGYQSSLAVYLSWIRESDGWMDGTVDRVWGGYNYDDHGSDIIKCNDKLYVSGYTKSYGSGKADALLLKVDTSFNEIWNRTWGGTQDEEAIKSFEYAGNIYLVGYTNSYGSEIRNAFLLKYSQSGNLIWDKVWSGEGNPPTAPKITGTTECNVGDTCNYYFKSTDPDGDKISYHGYWGDGGEFGPTEYVSSGTEVRRSHTWQKKGTFTIKAIATDDTGKESSEGKLTVHVTEPCCFPAGTKIMMADGSYKNIENIKIGDRVLSYDIKHNYFSSWSVKILGNPIHPVYRINDGLISLTIEHPLYIKKSDGRIGWGAIDPKLADNAVRLTTTILPLEVGDYIYTSDREWIKVTDITYNPKPIQTYNILSFSGTKTYFANDILVYEEHPGLYPISTLKAIRYLLQHILQL